MKYYGDIEITGKAKVDGGALIKNGLTSSKIKADEILIGSWSPYDTPPDEDKSLNIRNGAQILGDVVFANGNSKVQPPEVDFLVPVNAYDNLTVRKNDASFVVFDEFVNLLGTEIDIDFGPEAYPDQSFIRLYYNNIITQLLIPTAAFDAIQFGHPWNFTLPANIGAYLHQGFFGSRESYGTSFWVPNNGYSCLYTLSIIKGEQTGSARTGKVYKIQQIDGQTTDSDNRPYGYSFIF